MFDCLTDCLILYIALRDPEINLFALNPDPIEYKEKMERPESEASQFNMLQHFKWLTLENTQLCLVLFVFSLALLLSPS